MYVKNRDKIVLFFLFFEGQGAKRIVPTERKIQAVTLRTFSAVEVKKSNVVLTSITFILA